MRNRTLVLATLLVAIPAAMTACGEAGPEESAPAASPPAGDASAAPDGTAPDAASPGDPSTDDPSPPPDPAATPGDDAAPVRVWFTRGESLTPVARPDAESLREALETLLAGPTAAERSRGLDSWFSEETRGALREVRMDDGRALIDFDASLPSMIPGAGSSTGSAMLLGALDSTVFQFPSVDAVEYRLEGSCDAFWEWLQRQCEVVRRR